MEGPKKPLNILVMGSDSRDCEGCGLDQESGGGSDTTILFHLSADRQSAYGISIPRDSLVDRPECIAEDGDTIPGGSGAMWNEAFSYGGPACTMKQFEAMTGIRVTNYVVVDFGSFKGMVDAIDGVEVCVPEDINDQAHGITIKKGTRTLTGNEALSYVRVRHGVGDGSDIGRIKRQQAFIASMVSRVVSAGVLARPDRLIRFLNAATKSLTTDIKSIKDIADVGLQFKDIGLKRIRFITVPFVYSTAQPGRVEWTDDADVLWDRIAHDKPLGKLRVGSIGADQAPTGGPSSSSSESPSDDPSSTHEREPQRRRVAVRHRLAERRPVREHRRELRRPRVRGPLLVTERPERAPRPTGSASAGSPRCSATCSPTPPPTSATRPTGRRARPSAATPGSRSRCRRTTAADGLRRWAAARCPTARPAGRGSPGAA